jgi:(heptosyl)LPS beta-1,4-glucosyltransferase
VHETVHVDGRIGHLESNLLHFTCNSLSEHLKTMDRYTTLAAEQLLDTGQKVTWTRLALEPPWTFFRTYFLRLGFLDGVEGLAIANMAALYNFVKYAKARFMSPGR